MSQGKDRFIILKKTKYGESDLILQALSTKGEKLSFIARGALKSKKRFGGGVLEPTHYVSFSYKLSGEGGKLQTLQEATLINDFAKLRLDYDRLDLALHFLECVGKVSQEGDQNSEHLFNLLGHSLKALEGAQDILIMRMHFYLKLLLQQGVINAEPWMAPFLRAPVAETNSLLPYREIVDEELRNVDAMMKHYLANAAML